MEIQHAKTSYIKTEQVSLKRHTDSCVLTSWESLQETRGCHSTGETLQGRYFGFATDIQYATVRILEVPAVSS